ncbi:MAG: A/G-specific adenine glycosylase, partial [Candidatus Microthrix parvicella]|nr:A/G-specific adenine glycosylase [Candidatus Microthrix parvicella]
MPPEPMISAAAQGLVLSWWDRHRRDLPWRDTRDPWAVLIAEIMAQQAQVNRVVPRWHEFLERWPTPAVL